MENSLISELYVLLFTHKRKVMKNIQTIIKVDIRWII